MYKIILSIFFLLISNAFASGKGIELVTLEKLMNKGVKVIDIRTLEQQQKTGVIPTAYKITFEQKLKPWLKVFTRIIKSRSTTFVLVGGNNNLSKKLARVLHDKYGYRKSLYIKGGMQTWLDNKGKVIKP